MERKEGDESNLFLTVTASQSVTVKKDKKSQSKVNNTKANAQERKKGGGRLRPSQNAIRPDAQFPPTIAL